MAHRDRTNGTNWLRRPLPTRIDTRRLVLRLWEPVDLEAMHAVILRSLDHLRPFMAWVAEEPIDLDRRRRLIQQWKEWRDANGDVGYGVFLGEEPIGGCGIHCRQGPGVLEIGYWIAADHNRQGYATELTRALAHTALVQPGVDSVVVRNDAANIASQRVAFKAGFRFARRHTFPPVAPGHTGVEYVWRYMDLPGFSIRTEEEGDVDAIDKVVADAFGSPIEARLVRDIRASPLYRPELALVAEIDGRSGRELAGHVMISGCSLRVEAGTDRDIVILSPLAVAPRHQHHGVGAALVWDVLNRARAAGEPLVVVEGDPAYYQRFGFEPAADHALTVDVPDWAPPEAGQVIVFDSSRTELPGTVVYPPAFDDLD